MPDDFDSILGSRPTDAEDVLGARPQDVHTGSSPAADSFFSSNPIGRVMSAFGQGAKQGWGADHGDPLTDSTMKEIQKLEGVGDDRFDYHGNKERAIKSANETFIRPLITLGERGARLVGATLGAVGGGVGQALGEVGEPLHNYAVSPTKDDYLGLQHVQRAAAGATSEILGIAQLGGGMEFAHPEIHSIEEARANGVIGEPEGNFYGTREPTKQDLEGRADATANTGSVTTPPTVHDVARQIAPDVFQEYDNLQSHKNLLRTTLQNLSDNRDTAPEVAELQSKIDDILDKVNGVSSRLTQSAAARLADLEDQLDKHTTTDTPDMAQVRQDLLNADYRARDLSPAVTKAYQEASSRVLPEPPTRAPEEPQDAQTQTANTPPSPLPEDVSRANSEASDKIVQDAKKKFVNAGRSEEESELLGQLVAQRYLTRARTLGRDPYQLYAQEFPNVRAGDKGTLDKQAANTLYQSEKTNKLLVVARRMPDGTIKYGKSGDLHPELYHNDEFNGSDPFVNYDKETGFAEGPGEPFLTRKEARDLIQQRLGISDEHFLYGDSLEAANYNNIKAKDQAGVLKSEPIKDKTLLGKLFDVLNQEKKGSLTLNKARNTLRLFKAADASTAIHELGHQFLEELQKDAETEGVDPMVPADLKVVKDWLGLEDDDKITRRGHEQFARGFERYLREGRAPTSALAKVFRKFKEWLTQIYKKVGDLKAPITDDIRKVFDNMLTHTDQETTIVPESDADRGVAEPQPSVRDTGPVIGDSKSETTVNQETPGPNTPIEKTSTTHLDKAGNIRIDTLNSSDDVNSTLKQIAEWDNDHIAARRGKWTQRDVVDLAESAGLDRSEVNLKKLEALSTQDGIPLAARIWGLRKMLIQSATHLKEMMEGDDGVAYAEALQRHLRIQDTVAGVTAEWGRAGMAFKDLAKEYEQAQQLSEFFQSTLGKTFEQVKRDMALGRHLQTPGQISKFAKDSMKPSLGHMAQEVFINAFLSGPITHTSYLISNKLLAIMSGIPETIVKAGIGAVHQTLSGKRIDRAYFGEALQSMKVLAGEYSLLYGSRNGIKAAWKSFKAGQTVGLSGEGSFYDIGYKKAKRAGLEGEALTNSANNIARQLVSQYAYKKALDEGLDGPELIARARQIIDDPESAKIVADEKLSTPFTQTKYIPGVAGDILRSPSERLVAPIHSFDRTVNFEMYKAQLLYRRAIQDVAKSGDTSVDAVSRRLAVLHNNVPPEITAQARDAATNLTLMGQGGDLTKRLQNLTNWEVDLPVLRQTQPLKFISPFVHVFSMIQKLGVIERSPLGLLSPTIVDQLTGKHGTAVQHEAISKMAVGVAAMYAIYGMYQNGDANGNADPDYRKAAVELRAKGLPNSIRIGNMSYSFDRMGAIGSLLKHGIAVAKAAEAIHNSTGTEDGLKAAIAAYFHDMWTNISEEGTLNSFSDIIEAMEGSDKKKADWVENFLLGGVPFGVGSTQVARLVDNTQRAPVTVGEKIENKIPGMSSNLLPKYDVWGQPVPNKGFVGVYDSQVSNDPVDQALLQSKYYPAPVEKKILGVELSEEQHAEYAQKAGLTARMIITPLVTSSGWNQLSEKAKHDLMSNAFSAARQAGRAAVLADPKNKDLIQKSYDVLKGNK